MSTATEDLEEMIKRLPARYREQVKGLVEALLARRATDSERRLRQDWAGALAEHRDRFNSLDLQKKAAEWRSD